MKAKNDHIIAEKKLFYYSFLLPGLLLYIVFFALPVVLSAGISLSDWSGIGSIHFVGLKNFFVLFSDSGYLTSLKNTAILILYGLVLQIPIALVLAYLLFSITRGMRVYRAVLFFPVVIAPIAIATMFRIFYNGEFGPLNELLSLIHLPQLQRNWLSDRQIVLHSVILPEIWRFIGLHVVILLAALQGIPHSVIESARIDGASRRAIFFRIVLPMIKHIILISVVLCITGSLKSFEFPLILTDGGPGDSSTYLGLYMFRNAFLYQKLGYGSAITITILVYALLLSLAARRVLGGARAE
jgi:raffinose/stachyose/melibiose transport system permease protein